MVKAETHKRREALYNKIKDKDITISEALTYDIPTWNKKFGTKIKKKSSLEGQKNLLKQIPKSKEQIASIQAERVKRKDVKFKEKVKEKIKDLKRKVEIPKQISKSGIQFPTKKGQYGIVQVHDFGYGMTFWIKYKNKKQLKKRLDKLAKESLSQDFWITFYGFGVYRGFVSEKFNELLATV